MEVRLEDDLTIYSNLDEKSVELSQRVDSVNPMSILITYWM